jgi:hypothetical protein
METNLAPSGAFTGIMALETPCSPAKLEANDEVLEKIQV